MMINNILTKAKYIGKFVFQQDKILYETHIRNSNGQFSQTALAGMGDVVYFFVIDGNIIKIGKAAGGLGWYARMTVYTKKRFNSKGESSWDHTNEKIYKYMMENFPLGFREFDIFAIHAPRQQVEILDPLSGKIVTTDIETVGVLEQAMIQQAYLEGHTLDLCQEKDKNTQPL